MGNGTFFCLASQTFCKFHMAAGWKSFLDMKLWKPFPMAGGGAGQGLDQSSKGMGTCIETASSMGPFGGPASNCQGELRCVCVPRGCGTGTTVEPFVEIRTLEGPRLTRAFENATA